MTIEVRPVPGNWGAKFSFERWPGGCVLFLGPFYIHISKH